MARNLLIAIFCVTPLLCFCQAPEVVQKLKLQYPDDISVYQERSKSLTLLVKNDSLECTGSVSENVIFLKSQTSQTSYWRVYGSFFQEIENITAKAQIWEHNRYKELKIPNLIKKHDEDNSIFYDDSYFYPLLFPPPAEGNQVSWSYNEKFKEAKFLPSFYFASGMPMVESKFSIKTSKGIDLAWSVYNDPEKNVQFKQYEKNGYTFYEWTAKNLLALKMEEDSPKPSYFIPQLVYYVKSYPTRAGRKNVLSNLDDLYGEYAKTISKLNEQATPQLDSLVHSMMTSGTEMDIVRKIFYWVQEHIRYIAFEDGMRGFIPHTANYVYEKRYGDCKDMASLMVGMLRAANIKSYYTWIGTRDLPYRYSTLPTPLVDNHMIATYIDKNQNSYFLDATGNYTSADLPSSMIQGKEALIALSPDKFEIKVVPEIPSSINRKLDSTWIHIENKSIVGNGNAYFTGYQKIGASYSLDKVLEDSKKDNVVDLITKGTNKFYLDSYSITNLHQQDLPLKLTYSFKVNDYVNEINQELFINLHLVRTHYNEYISPTRKAPIEVDYKTDYEDVYTMEIPAGYSVEFIPPNLKYEGKCLNFEMVYTHISNKIILVSKIHNEVLMITPELFNDFNEGVRNLSKSYKESIILKKSSQ